MISNLFKNFDLYFEDVNANCDPEHVLNANCRSRYEQFHFIHINCARKIEVVEDVCASLAEPLKKLTYEFRPPDNKTIQDELERSN